MSIRVSDAQRSFLKRVERAEQVLETLRRRQYIGRDVPLEKQISSIGAATYYSFGFLVLARRHGENPDTVSKVKRIITMNGFDQKEDGNWKFIRAVEDAQRTNGVIDRGGNFLTSKLLQASAPFERNLAIREKRLEHFKISKVEKNALDARKIRRRAVNFVKDVVFVGVLPKGKTATEALEEYKTNYREWIVDNGLPCDYKLARYLLGLMYFMNSNDFNPLNEEDVEILAREVKLVESNLDLLEEVLKEMEDITSHLKEIASKEYGRTTDPKEHYKIVGRYLHSKDTIDYLNAYFDVVLKRSAA